MSNRLRKRKQEEGKRIASPTTIPDPPFGKRSPQFGLEHFNIAPYDKDEKSAFIGKLCRLSKLTWDEIQSSGRYQMGFEWISQNEIKIPIPPGLTDDVRMMVFRYNGKKAMVGYRVGHIYYPFWLDVDFSAYDHN